MSNSRPPSLYGHVQFLIPHFGLSVMTDPRFFHPKNPMIPTSLSPPPPPKKILASSGARLKLELLGQISAPIELNNFELGIQEFALQFYYTLNFTFRIINSLTSAFGVTCIAATFRQAISRRTTLSGLLENVSSTDFFMAELEY